MNTPDIHDNGSGHKMRSQPDWRPEQTTEFAGRLSRGYVSYVDFPPIDGFTAANRNLLYPTLERTLLEAELASGDLTAARVFEPQNAGMAADFKAAMAAYKRDDLVLVARDLLPEKHWIDKYLIDLEQLHVSLIAPKLPAVRTPAMIQMPVICCAFYELCHPAFDTKLVVDDEPLVSFWRGKQHLIIPSKLNPLDDAVLHQLHRYDDLQADTPLLMEQHFDALMAWLPKVRSYALNFHIIK